MIGIKRVTAIGAILCALLLLASGCNAAGSTQTNAPATKQAGATAAPESTSTGEKTPAAAETDAPKATEAAASGPQDIGRSAIFQYYNAVKLGMTKAEADAAIGLAPKEATGEYAVKNSFNYVDGEGYGVYVIFNDEMKAFAKTAIYKKAKELAPFTAKPVTKDQKKQISKGTAYADVMSLLGGEGITFSMSADEKDVNKVIGYICLWVNQDGSYLQVSFTGDDKAGNILYHDED